MFNSYNYKQCYKSVQSDNFLQFEIVRVVNFYAFLHPFNDVSLSQDFISSSSIDGGIKQQSTTEVESKYSF